jgi:hypothetical protein
MAWSPDGKEIWYTDLPATRASYARSPSVTSHVVVYHSIASIELFDIAPDGRVLMGRQQSAREVLAFLAGFSEPRPLVIPGEASMGRGITNDGRAVLVSNHSTHDYDSSWCAPTQSGAAHITSGDALGISAGLGMDRDHFCGLSEILADTWGMGPTRQIPNPEAIEYLSPRQLASDSRHLVFTGKTASNPSRGYVCDVESGAAKPFGSPGSEWTLFTGPPVSPDGKLVILLDADGGLPDVAGRWWRSTTPFPGVRSEDQPLTFSEDGTHSWSPPLYAIQIERLNLTTGQRTPWMTVAPTRSRRFALRPRVDSRTASIGR